MDPNIALDIQLDDSRHHGQYYILRYLRPLLLDSYSLTSINTNSIRFYLQKNDSKRVMTEYFWKSQKALYLNKFECRLRFFRVLSNLEEIASHHVTIFRFSDSQINESLFEELARSKWSLQNLRFASCEIGEKMASFLNIIDYKRLQSLDITSERISNRGIKELAKIQMYRLSRFWIENTNMTVDSMKIFQKMKCRLIKFAVRSQTNLAACLAFKEAVSIVSGVIYCVIGINPCTSAGQSIYLPHMVKISNIVCWFLNTMVDNSWSNRHQVDLSLMISPKAHSLLNRLYVGLPKK